jgi:hypothetical protein
MIVIPFVFEEPSRERAFTQEMEKAAILCLSEVKRKKPSLLRGSAEETECIAKLNYPLWAVPWKERCVVVDGLGLTSTTLFYNQIPRVQNFTEDLERSNTSFSLFKNTLEKHEHNFERFSSSEKVELEALVSDSPVLDALSHIIEECEPKNESPKTDVAFVPKTYYRANSENVTGNLLNEWQRIQTDINALGFALKILDEETSHHKEKASIELDQIWGSYEKRISEIRKDVEKKVKLLEKERKKEVTRAERVIEKEIEKLVIEEKKVRKKVSGLRRSIDLILAQKRIQKRKYPKRSTTRIDNRISLSKEKIGQLNSEIHQILSLLEKARIDGQQQLVQIEGKFQNFAAKETEKLEILERSRNIEMSKKMDEIKCTEDLSLKIRAQINNLVTQKAKYAETLENMTIPLKANEPLLIGIPFYLIQYRLRGKIRTHIYPPMTAASYEGIIRKIQKAIFSFSLESRMQLLITPRSKNLDEAFFSNLKKCLLKNIDLKEQIIGAAHSANILIRPELKEHITKGLTELETEGWLSSEEKENIQSIVATE